MIIWCKNKIIYKRLKKVFIRIVHFIQRSIRYHEDYRLDQHYIIVDVNIRKRCMIFSLRSMRKVRRL